MKIKKYAYALTALATLSTLALAVPALADSTTSVTSAGVLEGKGMMNHGNKRPDVFGTVTAVSGNTITVSSKGFGSNATVTTYTVDATNAKIIKGGVAGTIASIVVGDAVVAQGTLTGTNLVATMVHDGKMNMGMSMGIRGAPGNMKNSGTPTQIPITGNGQPVVAGTVSSINGSSLIITNKSNVSYTIDAKNAKVVEGTNFVTLSSVIVGDLVVVQGTVNGNSIVASSIIDQHQPTSTNSSTTTDNESHKGFFGSIGSFFSHIFGF